MNSGSLGGLEEDLARLVVSAGGKEDLGGLEDLGTLEDALEDLDTRTTRTSGTSRTARTTRIPRINKAGWDLVSRCPSAAYTLSSDDMREAVYAECRNTYEARHHSSSLHQSLSLRAGYLARIAAMRNAVESKKVSSVDRPTVSRPPIDRQQQAHSLWSAFYLGERSSSPDNLPPSPPPPSSTRKGILREPGSTRPVKRMRFEDDEEEREEQSLRVSVVHVEKWIEEFADWGVIP